MAQQTLNTPRETTHQRIADALEDIVDKIVDTSSASNIDYDNTQSGLDADKVQGAVDELASEKVDKVQGKGLSTNDYTDAEKTKLAGIEAGAQVNTVTSVAGKTGAVSLVKGDVGLGSVDNTSDREKPISRYTQAALDEKTDISNFNGITQEFVLFNTYDLTNDVEISVFANDTYKRDRYDRVYESHVPNLDGEYSVSLGDKTFTETCTFTIANEGKSITETFHTNRKYILGAKLLKAENDEVGDAHVIADVVTLIISKDAPYTTTFNPYLEHPPATGVLTLKVSVKPDEKYVNKENTGGPAEYAYWGSYNGSDLLINNPILTYSETTFGQPKVSGNPITIKDAAEANAVDVSVDIEPVQDLHGYDHPWVGGAGKNKLPLVLSNLKSLNTDGTWSENIYTLNGTTFEVLTDSAGNVDGIKVDGTANDQTLFNCGEYVPTAETSIKLNGVPETGSRSTYSINFYLTGSGFGDDIYSGDSDVITIPANENLRYLIVIRGGYNAQSLMFYPMARLATETDSSFAPYTNICPISGRSEVAINRVGKNLFKYNKVDNNNVVSNIIPLINGRTLYFRNFGDSINNGELIIFYYDEHDNEISHTAITYNIISNYQYTINPPLDATYAIFKSYRGTDYGGIDEFISAQFMVSDDVTSYEPYKGKTYTIQLGDTIYGGELDVVTGELLVTHGYAEFDGSSDENWALVDNNSIRTDYTYPAMKIKQSTWIYAISSDFRTDSDGGAPSNYLTTYNASNPTSLEFRNIVDNWRISAYTVNAWKSYLASRETPLQVCYELATPITIQLTPQQIRLLKGTNNIFCNTGDLSIKYYPDNVLGQLKGDIESEYDERVETLETQVQELQPSLIFMSRERRDITSDLSRLSTAVAEQNLPKYGYKIGDYFTGASGYTYILADYNTFKGTSTPYCISTNHIGIVVDTHQTSQWHSGDASNVGYNGSVLNTFLKGTVLDTIKTDFKALFGGSTGLEHLIAHSKLFTTALANWGWQANQYISALTCTQIDAGSQWTANGFQEGEASKSLELFRKHKWTEIFESRYPWLRNLSNYSGGSYACFANDYGTLSGHYSVTSAHYVVGLIIFH